MTEWNCVEDTCIQIDVWMATPSEGTQEHATMMQAIGEHIDSIGQCITVTRTWFRYTGGVEPGIKIGVRNYPRFPSEWEELIGIAEDIGKIAAKAGNQQTFMIEDGEAVYWFTRNPEHLAENHEWKGPNIFDTVEDESTE